MIFSGTTEAAQRESLEFEFLAGVRGMGERMRACPEFSRRGQYLLDLSVHILLWRGLEFVEIYDTYSRILGQTKHPCLPIFEFEKRSASSEATLDSLWE